MSQQITARIITLNPKALNTPLTEDGIKLSEGFLQKLTYHSYERRCRSWVHKPYQGYLLHHC